MTEPSPLRIGIDARTLSGHFTGDRTYWRGLIQGLAELDQTNQYFLYTRRPLDGIPPVLTPNFHWRTVGPSSHDAIWLLKHWPMALADDAIDVAHTQYNIPLLGAPCPVVTTIADITFALFPSLFLPKDRWILNTCIPKSLTRAAAIITVSESTRRDILRQYKQLALAGKTHAILLAADTRYHVPTESRGDIAARVDQQYTLNGCRYILSVGVLQPRKNLITLVDAFTLARLGNRSLKHKLVVVGKRGWKNEAFDRHMATLPSDIRADIIFTGYVPDENLPDLYAAADIFCYPSIYEGFGLPPLEAMACGCPVICSNTSSLPEVVGDAGILLPAKDSEAWARAVEKLMGSADIRSRWINRGLENAQRFSWKQTAEQTLSIYNNVRRT